MEKNMIWAVALSSLFLMGWYHFFSPKPVPAPVRTEAGSNPEAQTLRSAVNPAMKPGESKMVATKAVERTLDVSGLRLVIDSRGAAVKHWWVKDANGKTSPADPTMHWADLVNHPDKSHDLVLAEHLPLSTYPELNFEEVSATGNISSWRATLPEGVVVEKTFRAEGGTAEEPSQFVTLTLTYHNPGKKSVQMPGAKIGWQGGLGTVKSEEKENEDVTRVLAYPSPEKDVVVYKKKPAQDKADYRWLGVDNRYFLLAMMPQPGTFRHLEAEKSKTNPGEMKLVTGELVLQPGEKKTFEIRMYGGPKGYSHLKKLELALEHAVDFGMFGFLGKWALRGLSFLHGTIGNYGWAIVVMTILLQVLVLPLSMKSYKSMAAMKKLQPKIQELQKRYKDDASRLNQEMLALYRQSGTNPFGGCLPMILQIPIFWAFFTMLRNAYELRGTPWMFWIKDLSQQDPYYVLPVVMGGGMFLQQKLSGTAGADPMQAKMMMFMPVIFTFMFLKFPSGLVLYWLTNSVCTIAVQYFYTRSLEEKTA